MEQERQRKLGCLPGVEEESLIALKRGNRTTEPTQKKVRGVAPGIAIEPENTQELEREQTQAVILATEAKGGLRALEQENDLRKKGRGLQAELMRREVFHREKEKLVADLHQEEKEKMTEDLPQEEEARTRGAEGKRRELEQDNELWNEKN